MTDANPSVTDVTADWYWEGNVVAAIARGLVREGWTIVSSADTHSKERGIDLSAEKSGQTLLVEVKGYPSTSYRDPRRALEKKPTNPTNQAQQWYSHALLKVMRLQTKFPGATVALGLPDFPRYRALLAETKPGLEKIDAAVIFATAAGQIETWGLKSI
jgi:hypothetical protein